MWRRSVGIGLVLVGLLSGLVSAKNLWTIQSAWDELDSVSFAGIEFLGSPGVAEVLRSLWLENLISLVGAVLFAISGIVILSRSKSR